MLIKLIECSPKSGQTEAFSKAQSAWADLADCDGFYGQFGGWECGHQKSISSAVVMAFWQNQACIDRFMATAHDKIFDANKQVDTYSQCRVNYFSIYMPLISLEHGPLAALPIAEAGLLQSTRVHVTEHLVKIEDMGHSFDDNSFDENSVGEGSVDEKGSHQAYLAEQATVWQAVLNASGGFLGGYIAVPVATNDATKIKQPLRYLVITFWTTALAFQQHQMAMTSDKPNASRCPAISSTSSLAISPSISPTINPSLSQVLSLQFDINRAWNVVARSRPKCNPILPVNVTLLS